MEAALEVTPGLARGQLPVYEFSVWSCQEQAGVRNILKLEKDALGDGAHRALGRREKAQCLKRL